MSLPKKKVTSPPTFDDGARRSWTINITLDLLDTIHTSAQIDLLPDDNDPSAVTGLLFSRKKLGAVLWECVKDQAAEKNVDRKEFMKGLDGDALTRGWGALVDGITFFIQSQSEGMAATFVELIEAQMKVMEAGAQTLIKTLTSQETNQAMQQAVAKIAGELQSEMSAELAKSVTTSRDDSGLIRGRFRSVS